MGRRCIRIYAARILKNSAWRPHGNLIGVSADYIPAPAKSKIYPRVARLRRTSKSDENANGARENGGVRLLTVHFALCDVAAATTGDNLGRENIYRLTSLPGINPEEEATSRARRAERGGGVESRVMRKGRGGLSFPGA